MTFGLFEEMQKLERFIGEWNGDDDISRSLWTKSNRASVKLTNHPGLNGKFIIQDYIQECEGSLRYQWRAVIGWNAEAASYMMHLFDSAGAFSEIPFRGRIDGDALMFDHQGPVGYTHITQKISENRSYNLLVEVSPDNEIWYTSINGTYEPVNNK